MGTVCGCGGEAQPRACMAAWWSSHRALALVWLLALAGSVSALAKDESGESETETFMGGYNLDGRRVLASLKTLIMPLGIEAVDMFINLLIVVTLLQPEAAYSYVRKFLKDADKDASINLDKLPPAVSRWSEWQTVNFAHSYLDPHTLPTWQFHKKVVEHCDNEHLPIDDSTVEKLRYLLPASAKIDKTVLDILQRQAVRQSIEEEVRLGDVRVKPQPSQGEEAVEAKDAPDVVKPAVTNVTAIDTATEKVRLGRSKQDMGERVWSKRSLVAGLILTGLLTLVDTIPDMTM